MFRSWGAVSPPDKLLVGGGGGGQGGKGGERGEVREEVRRILYVDARVSPLLGKLGILNPVSILDQPGFLGTPAGMTTTSQPSKEESSSSGPRWEET